MNARSPAPVSYAKAPLDALAWDRLLAGIASRFIEMPLERYEVVVADALREVVLALGIDRSTIVEASELGVLRVLHW